MTVKVKEFMKSVHDIVTNVSMMVSILIIMMTITVSIEVIGRYAFNHPTSWVWPVNRQLFGIFILMALAYTELEDGHIRIEIFYDRFPRIIKNCVDWLTFAAKLWFMGIVVWQTSIMAKNSIMLKEKASGAFKIPLYPFKSLIFLLSLLIAFEIVIAFISKKVSKAERTITPR